MKNKSNKRRKQARRPEFFWFVNGNLHTGPYSKWQHEVNNLSNVSPILESTNA